VIRINTDRRVVSRTLEVNRDGDVWERRRYDDGTTGAVWLGDDTPRPPLAGHDAAADRWEDRP
jgi:hypothetical protein